LIRLAKQYGRYGYRKIAALLHIEGWQVNHKKVERLWREEGLQIPQRHKKRKRLYHKDSSVIRLRPRYQNHIWSIDFVHDKLANGRPYKMLAVLDEYTREALCVAVKPRMGNVEVLEALYPLFLKHGRPANSVLSVPLLSRHPKQPFMSTGANRFICLNGRLQARARARQNSDLNILTKR